MTMNENYVMETLFDDLRHAIEFKCDFPIASISEKGFYKSITIKGCDGNDFDYVVTKLGNIITKTSIYYHINITLAFDFHDNGSRMVEICSEKWKFKIYMDISE